MGNGMAQSVRMKEKIVFSCSIGIECTILISAKLMIVIL